MSLPIYRFVIAPLSGNTPHAAALRQDAHVLGFTDITQIACHEIYFIQGQLTPNHLERLSNELLHDSVTQTCTWQEQTLAETAQQSIEVVLRPGVTDPTAAAIMQNAQLLGIDTINQVTTGKRYQVQSKQPLNQQDLHKLAKRLLANGVIHYYALGNITVSFPAYEKTNQPIEIIPLRQLNDDQLMAESQQRRAALDLAEMQAIQTYFRKHDRDPTDVEFEMIAQTWSEHCSHKTFRAIIECDDGQEIKGLLKTYIRAATEKIAAPWVYSAFVDNAGIIDFDDEYQISFKVETHNHPSAIEPFGGANTGLGGVIRDVLGVSARPIAATDVFCFGQQDCDPKTLPESVLHPRLIASGVVAGVQDYGNKTGIPTVNGAVYYDAAYTANPLVFCGCVGLAPRASHPRHAQKGDRIIVIGGRTGRDGLRGATFSSMTMDAQTETVAGASVQIGDPIIAKGLIEVVTLARDAKLYNAITDCGAGGFSSAVGEMASECGAEVDISVAPLKYPGLAAWEIWLSEAQERMVLAVPPHKLEALKNICQIYDIELTDLGHFNDDKRLLLRNGSQVVLDLEMLFLFDGMPQKKLRAEKSPRSLALATPFFKGGYSSTPPAGKSFSSVPPFEKGELGGILLSLLSHPNIATKAAVIRRYDHEVQGATVIKPLVGVKNDGPSDACVLKPLETKGQRGIVLANGLNPELGKHDPYLMALSVIDEAIRNAVAVGADPDRIAILDNFCWGDPKRPETLGSLVAAARGCYDGALHYQTPFISGKDSLNNEYLGSDGVRHAIPPTLLISAIGIIEDVDNAVTMDLKTPGNCIYLLGETRAELGGSHFALCGGGERGSEVPTLPQHAPVLYRQLHQAMQKKLVRACHDLSEGGFAVAMAEMCIAGRLGAQINLTNADVVTALFSESNGRLLVEIREQDCVVFEKCFTQDLAHLINKIGKVTDDEKLVITHDQQTIISLSVNELVTAWQVNP